MAHVSMCALQAHLCGGMESMGFSCGDVKGRHCRVPSAAGHFGCLLPVPGMGVDICLLVEVTSGVGTRYDWYTDTFLIELISATGIESCHYESRTRGVFVVYYFIICSVLCCYTIFFFWFFIFLRPTMLTGYRLHFVETKGKELDNGVIRLAYACGNDKELGKTLNCKTLRT